MALEVRGAAVLEGRHMISVMVYLLDHDGCRKSDICAPGMLPVRQ